MQQAIEKRTFYLHLTYSIIEGIILGVLALNEFVLVKTLKGGSYSVSFLFQAQHIVFVFAILFYELLKRVATGRLLVWTALLTRLPLLFFMLFPSSFTEGEQTLHVNLFLLIFLIYYMATPIVLPAINQLLKHNYSLPKLGIYYSYAAAANKLVVLIVTFWIGVWYDINPGVYRNLYPILGIMGIISIVMLVLIDNKHYLDNTASRPIKGYLGNSISRMIRILRTDKAFRDFEVGFMLYGTAWMSTSSVTTLFFVKELNLNYMSIAIYKNAYNILSILLLPFFGRWLSRFDPRKFAIIPFWAICLYLLFVAITGIFPQNIVLGNFYLFYWLIPAYLSYGVFAATMSLSWEIGASYFCSPENTAYYQSLHLTLTGIRSLFAPVLGVWIYETFGFLTSFINGIIILLLAIVWMSRSIKRYQRTA